MIHENQREKLWVIPNTGYKGIIEAPLNSVYTFKGKLKILRFNILIDADEILLFLVHILLMS